MQDLDYFFTWLKARIHYSIHARHVVAPAAWLAWPGVLKKLDRVAPSHPFHKLQARPDSATLLSAMDTAIARATQQLRGPERKLLREALRLDQLPKPSKRCLVALKGVSNGRLGADAQNCLEAGRDLFYIAESLADLSSSWPLRFPRKDSAPPESPNPALAIIAAAGYGLLLHGLSLARKSAGARRRWCKSCFRLASNGSHCEVHLHTRDHAARRAATSTHETPSSPRKHQTRLNRDLRVQRAMSGEERKLIHRQQYLIDSLKAAALTRPHDADHAITEWSEWHARFYGRASLPAKAERWKGWLMWELLMNPRVAAITADGATLKTEIEKATDWHAARRVLRTYLQRNEFSSDTQVWSLTLEMAEHWLKMVEKYGDARKSAGAATVSKIQEKARQGMTRAQIARELGLSRMAITKAVQRDPWLREHFSVTA